ncbi:MAG: hypothetical protein WCF33_13570 [Pseudonocardiaceae bacterium]
MTTTTGAPTRETVRVALIELLNTSEHPDTASADTLAAVADTRRDLAALHGPDDPTAHHAPERDRHAALSSALGDIGKALLAARYDRYRSTDPWQLRAGLTVLAAVALGWLDTLPQHPDPHNSDEFDDGPDPEPF